MATTVALSALPLVGLAHGGAHDHPAPSLEPLWSTWSLDAWLLTSLGLAAALYAWGAYRLRQKSRTERSTARPREWAFAGGMLALLVALVSPLDRLSDVLFSAHMSQHELLMLVAAPLLVLARPWQALLAAAPPRLRRRLAQLMRTPWLVRGFRLLTAPLCALVLHGLVRWLWHAPVLFQAALADEWVHAFQHFTFFASAALFWWALMEGRYGRLGYGLGVLFVFATALHTGALGALMTFARHTFYPTHEQRTSSYQVDALADQQLAGLIMWVPAGVLLLSLALALFAAWLGALSRRDDAALR